jgi:preprotein translocase subunit YajC
LNPRKRAGRPRGTKRESGGVRTRATRPRYCGAILEQANFIVWRRDVFGRMTLGSTMISAILWQSSGAGSILGNPLIMMVVVMGIFYVMLILPQQRQRKKTQEMLSALKAGDKIITNGGIYGTVNGIDGDTIILKIADTGSAPVKIRIARSAITQVEASEDAK